MKFDPMTGQPIPEENAQPKFDPATGQPIQQQNGPAFDPMTGQPINQTPYQGQNFGSTPDQPKKKTGLYLGVGAAVLIVAALIFLVVKVAGMFGSPATKIEKALVNTFSQAQMFDTSVLQDSADDLQVDMELSGKVEGTKVDANVSYAKKGKEMSVTGDAGASIVSLNFSFYMNQSKVCFDMKGLDSPVFYDYTAKKDGDLEDLLGGEVTFDQIDTILKTISDSDSLVKDFANANSKALATLEFEKADAEKFEVNGKDVKCSGYTTILDKDSLEGVLNEYKAALENHEELLDLIEELTDQDLEDMYDSLLDEIDGSDEAEITFYLYKNQVAAIIIDAEGEDKVEVLFEGGSYPTQNMKVKSGKETIYEVKGEEEDGVITQEVYSNGVKTSKMEYDKESGEIKMTYTDDYSGSEFTLKGTYEKVKGGFKLEFDDIEYDSYYSASIEDFNLSITATKGAKVEKIDTKDAVDLGNADEDELEDLAEEFAGLFGGF